MSSERSAPLLDFNIDLGELPDEAEELYALATTANLACGGHAGDRSSIQRALRNAQRWGCRVAAHPSYPDRAGFGRSSLAIEAHALEQSVYEQCALLAELAATSQLPIAVVKPHGALYHDVSKHDALAQATIAGARRALPQLRWFVGAPASDFQRVVEREGLGFRREGFVDRLYTGRFEIAPRSQPGALLDDPAACVAQALRLARSGDFDTLCAHGDSSGALAVARAVRAALDGA